MSDDGDGSSVDKFINAVGMAINLAEENRDLIESVVGGGPESGYEGELSHLEPLREVTRTEDSYEVIMEVNEDGGLNIELVEGEGHVVMKFSGDSYKVDVPPDADVSGADASLNNGVLTVEIPIDEEKDDGVSLSVNENDDDIEEGE